MSIEYTIRDLLQAETAAIDEFRKQESERQGRSVGRDEAAMMWVDIHAKDYRAQFEREWKERNG